MNVHQALSGIAQIRQQIDRAESYRGFRSATTALSGVLAIAGGIVLSQTSIGSALFPAVTETHLFLVGWIAIACLSVVVTGVEMIVRAGRDDSGLVWRMHGNIAIQIVPAFVVGVALTWLLVTHSLTTVLPGVWAMTYGLALIACVQHLPASSRWVAMYFIVGGIIAIIYPAVAIEQFHLQMMVLFGLGQLTLGAILQWQMEQANHV